MLPAHLAPDGGSNCGCISLIQLVGIIVIGEAVTLLSLAKQTSLYVSLVP